MRVKKPELQATRVLLRVYDQVQRLFQFIDEPMAWGPMVLMVGCNMWVILEAPNEWFLLRPHATAHSAEVDGMLWGLL